MLIIFIEILRICSLLQSSPTHKFLFCTLTSLHSDLYISEAGQLAIALAAQLFFLEAVRDMAVRDMCVVARTLSAQLCIAHRMSASSFVPRRCMHIIDTSKKSPRISSSLSGRSLCGTPVRRRWLTSSSFLSQDGQGAVNIFDRATKRKQKNRAAIADDVVTYDYLRDEVGYRIAGNFCWVLFSLFSLLRRALKRKN